MKKHLFTLLAAALLVPLATRAQVTEFPYTASFENTDLDGWTAIDNDGDGYTWERVTYNDVEYPDGSYSINSGSYVNNVGALTPDNWLVSPAITLGSTDDNLALSWYTRVQDPNYPADHYAVYISTTGNTVADFTSDPVFEITLTDAYSEWVKNTVSLADYAGQTIYIAFRHFDCEDQYIFMIDAVSIAELVGCEPPTSLAVSDITTTSATVSFIMGPGVSSSVVRVNGEEYATVTEGTVEITGLEPATVYTVGISNNCTDGGITTYTSLQFVTLCEAIDEFPYTYGFEDELYTCLTREGIWRLLTDGPTYTHSGNVVAYTSVGTEEPTNATLYTPLFDIPADASGYLFEFYACAYTADNAYEDNSFEVIAIVDGDTTVIYTGVANGSNYVYERHYVGIDNFAGQTVQFGIRYTASAAYEGDYAFLLLDDLTVRATSMPVISIDGPSLLNINEATAFAAILLEGSTSGIEYSWTSATGNATFSSATDSAITVTYAVTGFDTITLTVSNDFGSATATLALNVLDLNPVAEFPYSTGFEDEDDRNWLAVNGTTNGWYIGSATHAGSADEGYAAYMSSSQGTNYTYNPGTASTSYITRYFSFAAGEYAYSYDWKGHGDGTYHYLRAFILPASVQLVADSRYGNYTASSLASDAIAMDNGHMSGQDTWTTANGTFTIATAGTYQVVFAWTNDAYSMADSITPGAIDNIQIADLTCSRPLAISFDSVDIDLVRLSWTPGGTESAWAINVDGTDYEATDTQFEFEAQPNTTYTVQVRSICGEGDTSFALEATVRTPCVMLTQADLPLVEGFEAYNSTDYLIDPCWTKFSEYSGNYPYSNSSYAHTGSRSLYFYAGSSQYNYAVLPPVDDLGGLMLSFWTYTGNPASAQIEVGTMTDPTDASTFTTLYITPTTAPSGTWTDHEVVIPDGTTANYLAFRNQGSAYNTIYVDDVNLGIAPSCSRPDGISVSGITSSSATVDINDPTEVGSYRIVWSDGTTTDSVDVSTTSYTFENLTPATGYTVTVYTICPSDNFRTTGRSASFQTPCEGSISELPWTEDFNSTPGANYDQNGSMPPCWDAQSNATSRPLPHVSTSGGYHYSPDNSGSLVMTAGSASNGWATDAYAILPTFAFNTNTLQVSFWMATESYGTDYGTLYVGYMDDNNEFVAVETIPATDSTYYYYGGVEHTVGFQNLDDGFYRIAFKWNLTSSYYSVCIDNVTVAAAGEAPQPVQYTVSVSSANTQMGTVSSTHTGLVDAGTSVTATATANQGYQFIAWTDADGTVVSNANPYTFTVGADVDLTANFVQTEGIASAEASTVSLSPNPATSTVTVGFEGKARVDIVDMNGRQVLSTEAESVATFEVGTLARGAYFVRVTSNGSTAVRKLVVK